MGDTALGSMREAYCDDPRAHIEVCRGVLAQDALGILTPWLS